MANPTRPRKAQRFTPRVPWPAMPVMSAEAFRHWLRAEVAERGGQVKAAPQLGIAQTALSQIIRGVVLPGHETAAKLGINRTDRPPVFSGARV